MEPRIWMIALLLFCASSLFGTLYIRDVSATPRFVPIHTYSYSPYVEARGSYPQFADVSSYVNAHIENTIIEALQEHTRLSEENWRARYESQKEFPQEALLPEVPPPGERFIFTADTTITRNDSHILSLAIRYGGYSGGAHGYERIFTLTYDKQSRREITTENLYSEHVLAQTSVEVINALTEQLARSAQIPKNEVDRSWIETGAAATYDNYRLFTLSENEITFYFEQYDVAPYAFGSQVVSLPYTYE